jgi:hypothetical protein
MRSGSPLFPEPGGLDIEFALQLLIDRLHPMAGDSPLPADPINVAMQGHGWCSFPQGWFVAGAPEDSQRCRGDNTAAEDFAR